MIVETKSGVETQKVAALLAQELRPQKEQATVVALHGNLGAGKTTFAQGFARTLGIKEQVLSPTFVLMKLYRLPPRKRFKHFIHIDCYRIEHARELEHIGLMNLFRDPDAVILIEWPERIRKLIPKNALWIRFRHGRALHERSMQCKIFDL